MARQIRLPALKPKAPSRLPVKLPAKIPTRLPALPNPDEPDVFEEMTLLEHMEELRDRIIKSVIAIGIAFVAAIFLAGPMLKRLQAESGAVGGFDVVSPTDPITIYFKIALYIAIGLALPVLLWQMVGFLMPGLTRKEKRFLILSMPFVIILFLVGVAYAFFFAAPRALQFLASFMSDIYEWSPEGQEVISFYLTLMVGLGVAFELPIVMFILAKLGVVTPKKMAGFRKYAVIALLVLSAVITPSTDPINMMVVFVPLYLLYEAGIWVSKIFAKTPIGAPAVRAEGS
ncbi:MAG: twin-arginine translocase subunit TatC [Thermomicrobiales bacterium]|nr:twin-arginine translocase subunit TatC [Thermomicrobiales bacterium]